MAGSGPPPGNPTSGFTAGNSTIATTTTTGRPAEGVVKEEPDERLVNALDNPRDRIFILKFECDAVQFIQKKDSVDMQVPPMNSYQRLLVHQLAEYYKLTHISDEKGMITLRISDSTRIPAQSLQDIALSKAAGRETPPSGPQLKIMKRTKSKNDAENDSASEKGGAKADEKKQSEVKDKAALRAEKEAAYEAARRRIFADFKEGETPPTKCRCLSVPCL